MLKIFSVHDSKAEAFIQPFFAPTTAVAIRMFEAAANDPEQDFHKFSADYTLYELGEFDPLNGMILILDSPKNLGLASIFKHPTNHRQVLTDDFLGGN